MRLEILEDDPKLPEQERAFLLADPQRGVNAYSPWLREQMGDIKIVAVRNKKAKKGNIVSLTDIVEKEFRIDITTPQKMDKYIGKHPGDVYVVENRRVRQVPSPQNPGKKSRVLSGKKKPILVVTKQSLDNTLFYDPKYTLVYASDYLEKRTDAVAQPVLTVFTKALARALRIAPLYVISKNEEHARNFSRLIGSAATYFSPQPMTEESFHILMQETVDVNTEGRERKIDELSRGVVVYVDSQGESAEGFDFLKQLQGKVEDGQRANEQNSKARNVPPVIYVKSARFLRNRNGSDEVTKLFEEGIFDLVTNGEIFPFIDKEISLPPEGYHRELLPPIERIVNAVHVAFLTRALYAKDPKEAFAEARQLMPHVFFHATRPRSTSLMRRLLLGRTGLASPSISESREGYRGINTQDFHISKEYQGDLFGGEALDMTSKIATAWKPNIIYLELRGDSDQQGGQKAGATQDCIKAVVYLMNAFKTTQFIIGYDANRIPLNSLEGALFSEGIRERAKLRYLPIPDTVILDTVANSWRTLSEEFAHRRNIADEFLRVGGDLLNFEPIDFQALLSARFSFTGSEEPKGIRVGQPVYPGAAVGKFHTDTKAAIHAKSQGDNVILYVPDLSNLTLEDVKELRRVRIDGLWYHKVSILNHPAIDLQKSGIPAIKLDEELVAATTEPSTFKLGDLEFKLGDSISFDGRNGMVYSGVYTVIPPMITPEGLELDTPEIRNFNESISKCDTILGVKKGVNKKVYVNADTVGEIEEARKWGVDIVALVRSENIVKQDDEQRLALGKVTALLLSPEREQKREDIDTRLGAFERLQNERYYEILKYQDGRRTQIRLLDPPLNQLFTQEDLGVITLETNVDRSFFEKALEERKEVRGVHHAEDLPEVYKAQIRALFGAYKKVKEDGGNEPDLRIFIPYVRGFDEVQKIKEIAETINKEKFGGEIKYRLGVTLETATGCSAAGEMIKKLGINDFAFGTNDLLPILEGVARDSFGASRSHVSYRAKAADGTPLILEDSLRFIKGIVDHIDRAAKDVGVEYSLGICGEMNEFTLHPQNFGRFIDDRRVEYFSAGAAQKIPLMKFNLTQSLLKRYRDLYSSHQKGVENLDREAALAP